jgi:MFS family permease
VSASAISPAGGFAAFRHRNFVLFLAARLLLITGINVLFVATAWLVYEVTRDPLALGLIGLAAFLPIVVFTLPAGDAADRYNRRTVLLVCYLVAIAVAAALSVLAVRGIAVVWPIYALVVVFGISRAFAFPSGQALLPNLVPPEHFANAVAWNSIAWQLATIAGPAIGGILFAFGSAVAFIAATGLFVGAFGLVIPMRGIRRQGKADRMTWASLIAGIAFMRSRPVVFGAISLDLFAVLLGGATALLPIYAGEILGIGPAGLGLLRSMPALGAVMMAALLAFRPLARRVGRRMFAAVALFGAATIVFGLSENLWLSLACLFVLGAADMISVFIRQTLVQLDTPDAMRGRVSAINALFIGASNELGEFESGAVAALIGTVPAVVVGGAGTLVVAALWARWFPELYHRDRLAAG